MTFPAKKARLWKKGYTILEICLVLIISLVIAGAALPFISTAVEEQQFQTAAQKIEEMARQARHQAIILRQPCTVTLEEKACYLEPVFTPQGRKIEGAEYDLRPGIILQVKRAGEAAWHRPENVLWIFQPNGLSEPMQLRIVKEKAWMELSFDPLTALEQVNASYMP